MAIYTGQNGVIKINDGSTLQAVAEVRGFSLETVTESIENTTMGDASRSYVSGLKSFSGSMDIFYEPTQLESGSADIPAFLGATDPVAFELYPAGETPAALPKITGNMLITGYNITSSLDAMIEASISFQGSGDLTLNGVTS